MRHYKIGISSQTCFPLNVDRSILIYYNGRNEHDYCGNVTKNKCILFTALKTKKKQVIPQSRTSFRRISLQRCALIEWHPEKQFLVQKNLSKHVYNCGTSLCLRIGEGYHRSPCVWWHTQVTKSYPNLIEHLFQKVLAIKAWFQIRRSKKRQGPSSL